MSLVSIIKSLTKVVWVILFGLALARKADAAKYEITRLNIYEPMHDPNVYFIRAICINEDGESVGKYGVYPFYDNQKAFFYKNGSVRDLGETVLWDIRPSINDLGDIVVCSKSPNKSFVYKIGENPIDLAFWSENINNKGEVVGGVGNEIYLYSEGKTITLLHSGDGVEAKAINEHTQVVGNVYGVMGGPHAFLWENGVRTSLPPPGGYCSAFDINNKSQIVGCFISGSPAKGYACIWEKPEQNWVVTQLGTEGDSANAINDKGQIVGISGLYTQSPIAVLWQNGKTINLNDFLPENSEFERLESALDINNKGQIVGYGYLTRNLHIFGEQAFLATPIPLQGDLNKDDIVNLDDLAILGEHWLEEK